MRCLAWVVLGCAACGHGDPWTFEVERLTAAHTPGLMTQLTHSPADDLDPAWFADGTAFVYTTQRLDTRDRDRCLAVMGAEGGTLRRTICQRKPSSSDTLDVYGVAAPGPDGRVAVLVTAYDLFPLTQFWRRYLVVDSLERLPGLRRPLLGYPYTAPGGLYHGGIAEIAWRSPTRLVYVAVVPQYPEPCKQCRPDAATPVQLVLVDLAGDTAAAQPVPNTEFATSVAAGDGDTLYFTRIGDGRVFRRALSTGDEVVVHDFGLTTIARDVQVAAGRLVAIVGGQVFVGVVLGGGIVQTDDGGDVHVLDLGTGVDAVFGAGGRLFRHASLSPDGRTLLAESRGAANDWDIWMIQLP